MISVHPSAETGVYFFTCMSTQAFGTTQPPIQSSQGVNSKEIKQQGCRDDQWSPTRSKDNNVWNYTSTLPYFFTAIHVYLSIWTVNLFSSYAVVSVTVPGNYHWFLKSLLPLWLFPTYELVEDTRRKLICKPQKITKRDGGLKADWARKHLNHEHCSSGFASEFCNHLNPHKSDSKILLSDVRL